jgi:hypothetical protein
MQANEIVGLGNLKVKEKEWIRIQRLMVESNPPVKGKRPDNFCRGKIYDLVNHKHFDSVINACILCNMVFLCIDH